MQPEPEVSVPSQIAITPLAMRIDDEEQEVPLPIMKSPTPQNQPEHLKPSPENYQSEQKPLGSPLLMSLKTEKFDS